MLSRNFVTTSAQMLLLMGLAGCAQLSTEYAVNPDRMRTAPAELSQPEINIKDGAVPSGGLTRLSPLQTSKQQLQQQAELALNFSDDDLQQLSANELPLRDFVQTVFGEMLAVNYVMADGAGGIAKVTLNVQQAISSRRLFLLSSQLLDEQQLQVSRREDVYYIHPKDTASNSNVVIGLGRRSSDVPDSINQILQLVPLRFGVKASLERTLRSLTNASITPDMEQNALLVQGSRTEVLRVLDLISLLDIPSTRGRYVGLMQLTYIASEELMTKIVELLQAEGISASSNAAGGVALLMVPIKQIGAIALFAGDEFVLERAEFWLNQLDQPVKGSEKRYFIYHPRYARASDLGASVAPLIGGDSSIRQSDRSRDTQSAQQDSRPSTAISQSVVTEDIRMTVDERSNSLIFFAQGETYQSLLPIIQRLDVLPKQILLDATIAEVTLTDEFAQGFEFAFRSGRLSGGTRGALGVSDMGGFQLNWGDGVSQILARLSASTSLINVLSNPTLVVRDGVSASITVGNEIPTVGSTTINPGTETQSTTIVRRKTGVSLTVTPTINAQGLVVMEIDQSISNVSASGPQLEGATSIFERAVKTEVLAQSGQTILLGGLISENTTEGSSHVPGLARIPLLGNLFKGQDQKKEKTELVIFITPRVIENEQQWQEIRAKLAEGLTSIKLSD